MGRRVDFASLAADPVADSEPRPTKPAGVTELPIDKVAANPLNQRTEVDEDQDELDRMADTIREHGLLQPLVVCTVAAFVERYPDQKSAVGDARWVTLIGNRRLPAARAAGLAQVPAVVNDERADSMYEVMLVENSHRRDLAPLREAQAMAQVLERDDISQRELARRIGRTHPYVVQRLTLLGLIPPLRDALDAGTLPIERARQLGSLPVEEQQVIADAGPPYRAAGGNGVTTPARRRPTIPTGDPAAAAQSIREVYTGEQLTELIRLLSEDVVHTR
ncbi:ParB/RepB/Spo0J family partition protein [Actinomycetospora sp.]|jgi:ParB family chromosome partitioning protein|uniref:ParB/RepB/Spo0J family partition protein n=1 Tax=Actinomycetospora sp. TaxID=1872135 RepID=UPI002F3EAF85